MVKHIQPKTEKARDFVAQHGDTFAIIGQTGPHDIVIMSEETGHLIGCGMKDGEAYINNEKAVW